MQANGISTMSMDLTDLFTLEKYEHNATTNQTVVGWYYFQTHLSIAVPHLIVLCLATILGCVGNILIIGAVLIDKVSVHHIHRIA